MQQFLPSFSFGGIDLRWVKLLRSMRVMRIGLLGAELRSLHLSTKRGGWLSAGANFRLVQLATSVLMLLFVASAIIQIVEQVPFHKALYFVATTLSTVGYGDVVAKSMLGRAAVLAMIAVGIVLIPVQAAAFYSEVNARRVVRGSLPDWRGKPFVLLSTRLTEVRAFSDLFSEWQQALRSSTRFPRNSKLIALCNRPSFEFSAFQELHERSVSLVEGSAVSGQDLVTVHAERAKAIMLLADRFSTDPESEDLGILFQVWACKSFTKSVPLFVQTIRESTVRQIEPFLDPGQDVIVSMEQTRFRLLALSAVCPGASTLVGNMLRSSAVKPLEAQEPTLAGRRWLRAYVNGCAHSLCRAPMQRHLAGQPFIDIAEWLFRSCGYVAIGVVDAEGRVRLNPAHETFPMGTTLLVLGPGKVEVRRALAGPFDALTAEQKAGAKEMLLAGERGEIDKEVEGVEECIPLVWGSPESESLDADVVPCVSPDVADAVHSEADYYKALARYEEGDAVAKSGDYASSTSHTYPSTKEPSEATSPAFSGHFILCGHGGSVVPFVSYLRVAEPSPEVPIVVLAPTPPPDYDAACKRFANIHFVSGSPTEAASLRMVGAASAKALVYLARGSRPVKTAQATGAAVEVVRSTREAVLADAAALLSVYGVGEESGATLTHAVVELLFTTSIEFLQPGLLLKGVNSIYDEQSVPSGVPRKSWTMRAWQQREAVAEGLAEWQANPYFAAGRVTVPALMDTFATHCFFDRGLLIEVLAELIGDLDRDTGAVFSSRARKTSSAGGAAGERRARGKEGTAAYAAKGSLLQQVALPPGMAGRTYGELFTTLAAATGQVCLGLYRRKSENPATRLSYVVANPPWHERLEGSDKVFLLQPRT